MKNNVRNVLIFMMLSLHFFATTGEFIYGVLIEGQDCVGKTTTINLVEEMLRAHSVDLRKGHGQLTDSPIVTALCQKAFASLPDFSNFLPDDRNSFYEFNKYRIAQLSLDILEYSSLEQPIKYFLLQDRHVFSQLVFNKVYSKGLSTEIAAFNEHYKPFLLNFYLTCSYEEKLKRIEKRAKVRSLDGLDLFFYKNPLVVEEFDKAAIALISEKKNENWMIIDTTFLSTEEVATMVYNKVCSTIFP